MFRLALSCLAIASALAGCAAFDFDARKDRVFENARRQGWRAAVLDAGAFRLFSMENPHARAGRPWTVYFEGDGRAWLSRFQPSSDPTPTRPVALRLALVDPASEVAYLGRPCQYPDLTGQRSCDPRFWTSHRLSEEVIASATAALDILKRRHRVPSFTLVGFSGGGSLAALVAARRSDVTELITLAANLDIDAWARLEDVTQMTGSVNPASAPGRLREVPQIHFVGADDGTVPPQIQRSYLRALGLDPVTHLVVVPGYDHECCWHRNWAAQIARARGESH